MKRSNCSCPAVDNERDGWRFERDNGPGSFKVDGADHGVPQLLIFKQDGAKLTGSGGPDQNEQYPIENGKIDGERVGFEITTGEWKFTYHLNARDARMAGDLELTSVNDKRTAKVTLSKAE